MATLDVDLVGRSCKEKASAVTKLLLPKTDIHTVGDLSICTKLERVDLSKNVIENADGLEKCSNIQWLNVSNNKLQSLAFVNKMKELTVLTAGNNEIEDVSPLTKLKKLKALILNNNQIREPRPLQRLSCLKTLVLSHNAIRNIDVRALTGLTKLQLSHNCLESFPDIKFNSDLKSLSLNDNNIQEIPADCIGNNRLELLELGKNKIRKFKKVTALSNLPTLKQVNLQDNDLCSSEDFLNMMLQILPNLRIINTRRVENILAAKVKSEAEEDQVRKTGKKRKLQKEEDVHTSKKKKSVENDDVPETVAKTLKKKKKQSKEEQHVEPSDTDSLTPEGPMKSHEKGKQKEEHETDLQPKHLLNKDSKQDRKKIMKGISALKDRTSGVVAIKEISKQKRKQTGKIQSAEDIFSTFATAIGSGNPSAW